MTHDKLTEKQEGEPEREPPPPFPIPLYPHPITGKMVGWNAAHAIKPPTVDMSLVTCGHCHEEDVRAFLIDPKTGRCPHCRG